VCEEATRVCVSDSLTPWTLAMPGRGARVAWFDGAYLAAGLASGEGAVVVGDPLADDGALSLTATARGPRLALDALDGEGVSLAWVDDDGFYRVASRASGEPESRWSVDVVRSEMNEQTPSYIATSDFTLVQGPDGLRALIFRDARSGTLRHASSTQGAWTIEQVDDGAGSTERCGSSASVVAREPSAALDPSSGDLYVAYHDGICGALKLARRGASSWTVDTIDQGDALPGAARAVTGRAPSLALTAEGEVAVSYQDRTRGRLYYTRQRLGVWDRELVDRGEGFAQTGQRPKNVVGAFSSLTFDANGAPAIAYFDSGAAATRLATRGAEGWSTSELDGDGLVGLFVATARSPAGGVVVSERVTPGEGGLTSTMSVTRLEVEP
jgi:hypothetical protein